MDQQVIRTAKAIASSAAYEAGRIVCERFGRLSGIREKDEHGDVVTEADHLAEAVILESIRSIFPGHRIRSEEAGESGDTGDWTWLVDPLDGTNNYAVGLPLYAVSITLVYRRQPVLAIIYEPMTDKLYVSELGKGAYCNGKRLSIGTGILPGKPKVGWIQGHAVQNEERAVRLRQHIDLSSKRMMRLWAPTLQWTMLARGDLDGIIVYNSEGEDLYSGLLTVQEAGGSVIDYDGKPFAGMGDQPYLIACRPENVQLFRKLVSEGLNGR